MPDTYSDDEHDLLDLAYPYALDAVSEADRTDIAGRLGAAEPRVARDFARIVADTQEAMSRTVAGDALAPPPDLRARILDAITAVPEPAAPDELTARRARRRHRLTAAVLAAAAVVVIAVGSTVAIRQLDRPAAGPTVEQVLASPDARTVTSEIAGGTLTLSSSTQANAVVVAMSDVPPPPAGHVYQMWFVPAAGDPRSAGTMSATTMPPPGGEVIPALDSATIVAVTVEPGTGSPQPTSAPIVTITLA